MGKQSAKVYYQGKYHSDIVCETDSLSGVEYATTEGKPARYVNNYQMYIGNKLVWERMPANLIFAQELICVSNDLVHFSSMQKDIDGLSENAQFYVISFCTFSNKFVCLAKPHFYEELGKDLTLLLYSDDGFKWKKFYETDLQFTLGYTNQVFAKCKCDGLDCIAVFIRNEIDYFDSNFNLVKSVETQLNPSVIPITFLGGETLYLYGRETMKDYGVMEEYVNGKLTIRHEFKYSDIFFRGYLLYIQNEDTVYSVITHGTSLAGRIYKHGEIETLEPMRVAEKDTNHYFPYMSEETIIIYLFDDDRVSVKYYELKNGSFHFKTKMEQYCELQAKRDGITSYRYADDLNKTYTVFTKDNFFNLDFGNQEPVETKGVSTFNPEGVDQFAYLERKGEA